MIRCFYRFMLFLLDMMSKINTSYVQEWLVLVVQPSKKTRQFFFVSYHGSPKLACRIIVCPLGLIDQLQLRLTAH